MRVLVTGALSSYTGTTRVDAVGETLDALFHDLDRRYPGLRFRVVDERGLLRPHLRVFVDGVSVRDLAHPLAVDAQVALVLALSGG